MDWKSDFVNTIRATQSLICVVKSFYRFHDSPTLEIMINWHATWSSETHSSKES